MMNKNRNIRLACALFMGLLGTAALARQAGAEAPPAKSQTKPGEMALPSALPPAPAESMQQASPASAARLTASELNARYSDPAMLPSPDGYAKPRTKLKMPQLRDPKEQAFDELLDETVTFSRDEINRYYDRIDDFKRSVRTPDGQMHRAVISSVIVNLQPGSVIPVMRLNVNENSSLLFTDSTGNPWPVVKFAAPSKSMFAVEFHPNNNPHEIALEPIKDYAYGNLKVFLAGMSTPVFVRLVTGQKETDVRLDARMPVRGPNAAALIEKQMPPEASSSMFSMLNGVVPEKAQELRVEGADARAWMLDGKMYLRLTNKTSVRSPSWTGTMSSIDGTNVYELPARTPVIYAAQEGKSVELRVSGF